MPAPGGFEHVSTTKSNKTRSIAAHPCKGRKDGHPQWNGRKYGDRRDVHPNFCCLETGVSPVRDASFGRSHFETARRYSGSAAVCRNDHGAEARIIPPALRDVEALLFHGCADVFEFLSLLVRGLAYSSQKTAGMGLPSRGVESSYKY